MQKRLIVLLVLSAYCLVLTSPVFAATTLSADTISAAGEPSDSGSTFLKVGDLGQPAGGSSSSTQTMLTGGYAAAACTLAVCTQEPKEGGITVLGTVVDATQPAVTVKNDTLPEEEPVNATVTPDATDPTLWHFTAADVPVLEGENVLTATATDAAGHTHSHTITITYDATPPSRPTVDPVISPRQDPVVDLRGQKSKDTEIWINGVKEILLDAQTTWERLAYPLAEGFNSLVITAKDEAKNESAPVVVDVFVDATPPAFSLSLAAADAFYDPDDQTSYTNLTSLPVTVTVTSDDAALVEALVNGVNPVTATPTPGSQAQDGQTPDTYTATVTLVGEGSYTLEARVTTVTDWVTIGPAATIFVDQTVPDAPSVTEPNPPPTPSSPFTFTGTKEAGAGLFRDSTEVLPVGDDTIAWSEDVALVAGPNSFAYTQEDRAGNVSLPTPISIIYDPTAPTIPVVTDDGATTPDYTALHATATTTEDWTDIVNWCWTVGTSPGADDVLGRTCTGQGGLSSEVSLTGLTLQHAVIYYLNATAENAAGSVSVLGSSDGIVPSQPPQVLDVEPEDGDAYAIGDTIRLRVLQVNDPDGDATFEYQFWVLRGTTEVFRQTWSSSNEAFWDTTGQAAGFYDLFVEVRDVYGASMIYGDDGLEDWGIRLIRILIPMPPDE